MSDKLKMHTPNKADENFAKLAALFPNAVTETKDEHGDIVRAIDKDILMQEISATVVEGADERYQFTWPDKKKSILLANAPINKTLRPCKEESLNFDTTENLYIEGDNLEVLKLLQETYLGKIKMIYIDPPYNTGNDAFVYNDDFEIDSSVFSSLSNQYDEEGNLLFDIRNNNESNGRFHTDWLNMIYPRLKIAKDLLTDDGVIFISIDDNELDNLSKICDEIYGNKNFVANLIWQKKTGASDATNIAVITENILVYAKNVEQLHLKQNEEAHDVNRYKYKDDYYEERGSFYYDSLDRGTLGYHESLDYPVTAPDGTEVFPNGRNCMLNDGWRWKWGKEKLAWGIKNGFIEVKENSSKKCGWGVYYKIYEKVDNDGNTIKRSSPYKNLIQDVLNTHASTESKEIFGRTDYFSNPKPVNLIKHFVMLATKKDDIVLDFFSGSGTTAQSIMQLNIEDGMNRKFIMVQLPEKTQEKSPSYKAGYTTLCEIGKERIRRAAKKIAEENPEAKFDGGFRVLKCDTTNMKDVYYNPADFEQSLIPEMEDNIKDDRTPEDLLFQVMLDLGVLLSSKIEETTIEGKKVFNVADNFLIACFDYGADDEVIKEIAKKKPYYFVMRDYTQKNDSVATNFEQIFATFSPDTVRKVL